MCSIRAVGKSIVALGSKFTEIAGRAVRTDILYVSQELVQDASIWPASIKTDWELMHVNSFYEIPPNANSTRDSAFAAGNYIVNDPWLTRILVFDRDLKRIAGPTGIFSIAR